MKCASCDGVVNADAQSLYTPTLLSVTLTADAESVPPALLCACVAPVHVASPAGKKTTVPDPYDSKRKWKTYDPLACVGFFNPKEEAADSTEPVACRHGREQIPGLFLPAAQHVRTLYCYLKASKSPTDEVERERAEVLQGRVEAALDEWKKDRKVGAQLGTSNATPSRCSSQHGTPRSSRSEASRSEAHARMQPRALSRTLTPVAE